MRNSFVNLLLSGCLIVSANYTSAEEIVAIVDLKFIEETDKVAAVMCFGDHDEDCGVWATHYLFEAKVDKIISGELPDKRFLVLFGRHALRKKNFRNIIALLKKLETTEETDPQYQITQWGEKRNMYCFDRREDDETEIDVEIDGKYKLNCFDPDYYYGRDSIEIHP